MYNKVHTVLVKAVKSKSWKLIASQLSKELILLSFNAPKTPMFYSINAYFFFFFF